ncbi:uncharacterized protein [Musca autumnalis]|uniref:uncharacterized protein n=1 Tax=Musca autumnalis TaxID=221902 RepID=UPI003CFB1465
MCDIDCANLIDLSLEENTNTPSPDKTDQNVLTPSDNASHNLSSVGLMHFISPPRTDKRPSLDNNPFDHIEKLAECKDDPFEIVEREACLKAKLSSKTPSVEVKLGNLLSLSDENLLLCGTTETDEALNRNKLKEFDLESESPPVTMLDRFNSGTDTDSTPGDSAEMSSASKMKKTMEYRKRLLKLSVTNAAFNSPISRRNSMDDTNAMGTPVSSSLNKTPFLCEYSLAAESPLKFVDDDIMSEEPPALIDAEKNFEADLEMLKIPMLSELQSPVTHSMSPPTAAADTSDKNISAGKSSPRLDLEAIKSKLKSKREETYNNIINNHQDINSLICDLKSLLNSGEMMGNNKQMQASSLLESLSSAITTSQTAECKAMQQSNLLAVPEPQPIKRQGTFDLDIKENNPEDELANQPLVSEMPNCMISSSATYDGESAEDKQDLNLPEIDPPSPQYSDGGGAESTLQHDVNDIVEQLSKLLIHNNSADGQQCNQTNPTVIVVMNTPLHSNSHHNNSITSGASAAKHKSSMVSSYIERSSMEESPELNMANSQPNPHRRRSQSLSLHDKVKIVQIPLHVTTPKGIQKQHSVMDDSPPVTTTPPPKDAESGEFKTPEFKTPARMVRRNSYSSGTPYTATVGMRRTGIGSSMTQTLDTHIEGQQQQQKAIVRPMPTNNLPSFKPDLKKKHKTNTESIMKSSGPLKATIPVKKVAPMLKTSPPTPDNSGNITDDGHNSSKVKLKIPTTPMASGRSSSMGMAAAGYPNACSTPSLFTSPMKRSTSGTLQKPRYSYLSATPNAKSTAATSTSSSSMKRRTISEFKAKSPLKSRLNTTGGSSGPSSLSTSTRNASTSSRLSTSSSRLSTSSSSKLSSKAGARTATSSATVKPTGRLTSRVSSAGSTSLSRNKENKHP